MASIAQLCLLGLLLGYAAMCYARNMAKENQNRQYEYQVDDYGEPGPNPVHDPHNPPPPPRGNENRQHEIDDYGGTGPNPIHDPYNTPPPPFSPRVYPKMHIHVENYEGTWAKPKRGPHSATPLMSEGAVLEPSKVH